jgi:hypothetical protein
MFTDNCYDINEDNTIEIIKDFEIDWITNYRTQLNAIHNNYPKCKI